MSTSSSISAVDTGILLEAGTNEAEVLAFQVRGERFGVNVAKVREVLPLDGVTCIPHSHAAVEGLVRVREMIVPLVNLRKYLYNEDSNTGPEAASRLLLLEFNNAHTAFRVDGVERIFRVSWKDTLPAPHLGDDASPVTSILRQREGLLPLLDFESICATIGLRGMSLELESIGKEKSVERTEMPIVYADDSQLVREMVKDSLTEAGYCHLKGFPDGQEAWEYLTSLAEEATPETIREKVACIVTDVEMPRMDGLSLTKKIRSHPVLGKVPVIVFSSIASNDNRKKGQQVGATAQVAKARYDDLIDHVGTVLQMKP